LEEYIETGRRKRAVASVRLRPQGSGKIDINGKTLSEYFPLDVQKNVALAPLKHFSKEGSYDLVIRIKGGGIDGQAVAVRHGLSRALVKENETVRSELKALGYLTRDQRKKERKKYGLAGARKRFQFSKR